MGVILASKRTGYSKDKNCALTSKTGKQEYLYLTAAAACKIMSQYSIPVREGNGSKQVKALGLVVRE
jgi:hypothetical protein